MTGNLCYLRTALLILWIELGCVGVSIGRPAKGTPSVYALARLLQANFTTKVQFIFQHFSYGPAIIRGLYRVLVIAQHQNLIAMDFTYKLTHVGNVMVTFRGNEAQVRLEHTV